MLSSNIGITTAFVLGYCFSFSLIAQVPLIVIAVYVIFLIYLPESPIYLVKNHRISVGAVASLTSGLVRIHDPFSSSFSMQEAKKSIQYYSSLSSSSSDAVQIELTRLKSICNDVSSKHESNSLSWSDFKTVEARRSLAIGLVLVVLNQLSGLFAVLTYSDDIIREAGVNVSPAISGITISILLTVGAYIPTVLSDRVGRKVCTTDHFCAFPYA